MFENGIPNLYDGGFESGEEVVRWIVAESTGDNTIEIVTDNMLDQIVATHDHVAVVFYKKGEEESETFIEMLEHIDDEANENEFPIKIVRWGKISSLKKNISLIFLENLNIIIFVVIKKLLFPFSRDNSKFDVALICLIVQRN